MAMRSSFHYFDHNATTRVAPEVLEAMWPFLSERWGNPSSGYRFGHDLAAPLAQARQEVASLLHADPKTIVFTSCGTESNQAAFENALRTRPDRRHVITTAVEHSSNIRHAQVLARRGYDVTILPVDSGGQLDLRQLEQALRPDTALVSIMWANNETGVVFPVAEAAALCRNRGVLFHTDAVQAAGKLPIDVQTAPVDLLSLSAHKLQAPKGIGLLYVREGVPFEPLLVGGGQENGRRGGTENVAFIIGFGVAARTALARLEEMNTRVRAMRDRLETHLLESIPGAARNGAAEPRLPNTSNLSFAGVEAEGLLHRLDDLGFCISTGSACASGSPRPSHVLTAMGFGPDRTRGAIRISLGLDTTDADVSLLMNVLPDLVKAQRAQGLI